VNSRESRRQFAFSDTTPLSQLTFPSENHHRAGHAGRLRAATPADMARSRMGFRLRGQPADRSRSAERGPSLNTGETVSDCKSAPLNAGRVDFECSLRFGSAIR
jgi:hypothetical protein